MMRPEVDRRAPPSPLKMIGQLWPIVSMIAAATMAGVMQWADLRRDLGVIDRRMMENDRRILSLEASDLAQAALTTELKVTLAEIKAEIRAVRIEIERQPGARRRTEVQP